MLMAWQSDGGLPFMSKAAAMHKSFVILLSADLVRCRILAWPSRLTG